MRSFWRTLDRGLLRDIGLVCLADGVVGASFGAIAVSGGQPAWVPVTMSLLVFAGGAQFAALGIVLAGGNPFAAAVAGLLLNARHVPFGFAVADVVGRRLAGAHLMIDESVAFALAQREPDRRRAAFWTCGVLLFVTWNVGVLVGVAAGRLIGDSNALGLDAASPVVLLALVLPSLHDHATARAAVLGGAIALASTPFLPAGLPVAAALLGLVATWRPARRRGALVP
ncbi:MAG TPA: AzlC family ABC transporter permease [Pseudonocardiaceae bacterium]|nr:AzlC family ABC transporter permease [Pseudonocardiaceae bacterium]